MILDDPFDCLIFDCDGTLVDSESLACELLAAALRDHRVELRSADLLDRYRGWRLPDIVEELERDHEIRVGPGFVARFRDIELAAIERDLRAMPHVADTLSRLTMPKCVASSSPQRKIRAALRATGLEEHFGDRIYSSYDIDKWKPDPALFLHAAREMGAMPSRCAVVEDSLLGILAATRAGMSAFHYEPSGTARAAGVVSFGCMTELPALLSDRAATSDDGARRRALEPARRSE